MALSTDLTRTIFARVLGSINLAGGGITGDDLAHHARFLQDQHDPNRQFHYFDFLNVARQAWRSWVASQALDPNSGPLWTHRPFPIDPTITPNTDQFRARVLVTMTLPDGSTRRTLVVVNDTGAATPAELVSRAIAAVQRDMGTNLVPTTFSSGLRPGNTYSGQINTIGRAAG